ncbi:MAG TPA: serine protease [Myxococcales bacterium]|nr:serine protease [Myxococcales bacterium]
MNRIPAIAVALLCACATYKKPLPVLKDTVRPNARPVVFKLSERARQARLDTIVFNLPMGYRYGEAANGGSCNHKQPFVNTKPSFELAMGRYADVFGNVMRKHGYPVENDVEMFKDTNERVADLRVGARITEATLNECFPSYDNDLKAVGSAYLKIEWSVYSALEKKIVFTTTTEGTTYGEVESSVGEPGIIRPALADAIERLALVPSYRNVIDPPAAAAEAPRVARIKIKRAAEFAGDVRANLAAIKKAVVTVTANKGFGSGFVVSADGAILTAEHVVSGSKFVKVNTPAGKECYGEVAAENRQRDLALIRVDCAGLVALPLARGKMVEGSEVFAVGTPLSEKLQFSITRGVVSGFPHIDDLDYIQSDVTVLPGNSGGPLLDSRGNAVGVTDLGTSIHKVPVGLNFFIPLADLEKYLPIDFE